MPQDLKSFLKTQNKQEEKSKIIQEELSSKSQQELSQDFETALGKAKQNGTFNKEEMLSLLENLADSMPKSQLAEMREIIRNL